MLESTGGISVRRWRWERLLLGLAVTLACCALAGMVAAKGKKQPPKTPLDLNSATAQQLVELPGVGPATAKAILQFRQESGPFERVDDLLAIRGISRRKLARMRRYLTVKVTPPDRPAQATKQTRKNQSSQAAASASGGGNNTKKR